MDMSNGEKKSCPSDLEVRGKKSVGDLGGC